MSPSSPRAARILSSPSRPLGRPLYWAAVFAGAGVCLAAVAQGRTLEVRPGVGTPLTSALNAASRGDVVEVGPGIYTERLELPSGVVLRSREGAAATVLQGDTLSSILVIRNADSLSTVEGFTFTGGGGSQVAGWRALGGGAILCLDSDVRIRNNVFRGNRLRGKTGVGGAVAIFAGHVILENNRFEENSASRGGAVYLKGHAAVVGNEFVHNRCSRYGGGLMAEKSVALVERNVFRGNRAGWGGGLCIGHLTQVTLRRNTLVKNRSRQWGGAVFLMDCEPVVERNLLVGNVSDFRGGGFAGGIFSYPYMKDNLGWGNIPGNFTWVEDTLVIPNSTRQAQKDPKLSGIARGDYHPLRGGPAAGRQGVIGALDPAPEALRRGR